MDLSHSIRRNTLLRDRHPTAGSAIASHIVPWKQSSEHRANPRNGLCLSRLHDGAFDKGLITFDEDLRLVVSRELADHYGNQAITACFGAFGTEDLTDLLTKWSGLPVHTRTAIAVLVIAQIEPVETPIVRSDTSK